MPYERWISADTGWLLALVIFTVSAWGYGEFEAGAIALAVAYLWSRHREKRKDDWYAEQVREFKADMDNDIADAD